MPELKDSDWMSEEIDETEESTARPLSLKSLFEETRLPFELEDGSVIFFRDSKSVTPQDSARMMKMQKMVDVLLRRLEKNPDDQDALIRYDRVTTEFVHFVLPDLSQEVLGRLKYGQKGIILKHWMENSDIGSLGNAPRRGT